MIIVFWRVLEKDSKNVSSRAEMREFYSSELSLALSFAEELRKARKDGSEISHITIQSEMKESVGQAGVAEITSEYGWYKRRIDPSTTLGRKSGEK